MDKKSGKSASRSSLNFQSCGSRLLFESLALVSGLALLYGRFDWSSKAIPFSTRTYLLSAYLFLCLFGTFRFFAVKLLHDRALRLGLSVFVFFTCTLPFHWLGLEKFFFGLSNKAMFDWKDPSVPVSQTDWFPSAFALLPAIPGEAILFASSLLIGWCLIWRFTRNEEFPLTRRMAIIAWGTILLQTWMHLSLRSPYTYLPHFELAKSEKYWYHYFLFPDGKGAVNFDYFVFRPAEELFFNAQHSVSVLISRALPAYFVSHFAVFFNSFYVWLVANCVAWFMAVAAIAYLANRVFDKRVALYSSFFMVSAQGVILYVAQPMVYTMAICSIAVFLASFYWVCTRPQATIGEYIGIGAAFGLFLLMYEGAPWIVALPILGISLGARWWGVSVIILTGITLSQGFLFLGTQVPEITYIPTLTNIEQHPFVSIKAFIQSVIPKDVFVHFCTSFFAYADAMLCAFPLTIVPAFAGLFLFVKCKSKSFLLCLLLPGLMTYCMFYMARSLYTDFPRLVYSAYPMVYLLAGLSIAEVEGRLNRWRGGVGKIVAGSFIFANWIYLNADVWGFPGIYFSWFYRTRPMGAQ